jgi:hypothetical protein
MTTPVGYLAYTPRGAGLLAAVVYVAAEKDVYGWWTGASNSDFPSAFFLLEDFFRVSGTTFYATRGMDLYGGWAFNYSSSQPELDKPEPVADDLSHELEQLQDAFWAEWLFVSDDKGIEDEVAAYARSELPLQQVNIKIARLNKLDKEDVIWTYASPGIDLEIIDYMRQRWPLDYRMD